MYQGTKRRLRQNPELKTPVYKHVTFVAQAYAGQTLFGCGCASSRSDIATARPSQVSHVTGPNGHQILFLGPRWKQRKSDMSLQSLIADVGPHDQALPLGVSRSPTEVCTANVKLWDSGKVFYN